MGIRVPHMGYLDSLILWGEELLIPAQGYNIHMSTRVNLHHHGLCTVLGREHQLGVE